MANYKRRIRPGSTYFFTVVTHKRKKFLTNDLARTILKDAFKQVQTELPFETLALCLMPDHIHCIWRMPPNEADFSKRWSKIKGLFTKQYLKMGGTELPQSESRQKLRLRGIWQRRFWEHRIRDEDDMANHLHYIHFNPVKHGYVDHPNDWEWSTYKKYKRNGKYDDFDWSYLEGQKFNDMIEYGLYDG